MAVVFCLPVAARGRQTAASVAHLLQSLSCRADGRRSAGGTSHTPPAISGTTFPENLTTLRLGWAKRLQRWPIALPHSRRMSCTNYPYTDGAALPCAARTLCHTMAATLEQTKIQCIFWDLKGLEVYVTLC